MKTNLPKITDYFFELGMLKKIKRTGAFFAGISNPDSVADHVFRASQIAFVLGKILGADYKKCALIILFHDNAESRIGDLNKVNLRYINKKSPEKKAFSDQVKNLSEEMAKELKSYFAEYEECKSLESKIANDSDLLEMALQAKEWQEIGYSEMKDWINNIEKKLIFKESKEILKNIKTKSFKDFWKDLKKI